jgi:hypothetical protein
MNPFRRTFDARVHEPTHEEYMPAHSHLEVINTVAFVQTVFAPLIRQHLQKVKAFIEV